MTALVFLYFTARIFIYGGELNAAIARDARHETAARSEGGKVGGRPATANLSSVTPAPHKPFILT